MLPPKSAALNTPSDAADAGEPTANAALAAPNAAAGMDAIHKTFNKGGGPSDLDFTAPTVSTALASIIKISSADNCFHAIFAPGSTKHQLFPADGRPLPANSQHRSPSPHHRGFVHRSIILWTSDEFSGRAAHFLHTWHLFNTMMFQPLFILQPACHSSTTALGTNDANNKAIQACLLEHPIMSFAK
jgi:hypothetical protein